ncbi:MAG: ABC transporter ATP-binding protein [Deltaproteobacteria bacterium]|nr:ABC transporter ATP-binding protein [Deltaproteobacteria bacterium]
MSGNILELKGLGHRYITNWALVNVSLSSTSKDVIAILGPNGCGKSTLLKILSTRLDPTCGEGTLLGLDLKQDNLEIRTKVEWLGHELGFYKALTAEENLKFSMSLCGKKADRETISEVLAKMGIVKWRHKAVGLFSTGMKKRLALARVLLRQPKAILLDEPHANLDRDGKQLMNACILHWKKQGVPVFFASHDHSEVLPLCDKALVLNHGTVAYFGDPQTIPSDVIL